MTLRRSMTLVLSLGLLLGGATGCEKSNDKETVNPDEAKGPQVDADAFRYAAEGFVLEEVVQATLTTTGDFNGGMSATIRGTLDVKPHDKDRLLVHATVDEVTALEDRGEFLDPDKDRQKRVDDLIGDDYFAIFSRLGDGDFEASKELPENKKREEKAKKEREEEKKKREEAGEDADETPRPEIGVVQFLTLPDLPTVALEPGETKTLERQKDVANLFGAVEVPVERDYKFIFKGVEEKDGRTLATYKVFVDGQGATDIEAQAGDTAFLSMLEESDFTVVVDAQTHVPVSMSGYSATEINFDYRGQEQRIESNTELDATYAAPGSSSSVSDDSEDGEAAEADPDAPEAAADDAAAGETG